MTMPHKGYKKTAEHQAKITAALKGHTPSPEAIAKRTAARVASDGYGVKHGHARVGVKSATYITWGGMIQRCFNPKAPTWEYYGGRGITVCARWRSFENFLADMGERPQGRTLDRLDNDGNYEPGNCQWATRSEQLLNRRRPSNYDRPSRVNECGHPDRSHKARGMCWACYRAWRLAPQKRQVKRRGKLSADDVTWVRANAARSQRVLAETLGVSQGAISLILSGKRWKTQAP